MATRNKQRPKVTTYDFTFPGTVAFYEGMETPYLQELYFKKLEAREDTKDNVAAGVYTDKAMLDWVFKSIAQIEREMLTIQQIINSRQ